MYQELEFNLSSWQSQLKSHKYRKSILENNKKYADWGKLQIKEETDKIDLINCIINIHNVFMFGESLNIKLLNQYGFSYKSEDEIYNKYIGEVMIKDINLKRINEKNVIKKSELLLRYKTARKLFTIIEAFAEDDVKLIQSK